MTTKNTALLARIERLPQQIREQFINETAQLTFIPYTDSDTVLSSLEEQEWQIFCDALVAHQSLKSLNLSHNDLCTLNENQWLLFCKAITKCKSLQHLDLSNNDLYELSEKQWHLFCTALTKCSSLQSVELSHNLLYQLSEHQWRLFCQALTTCNSLQNLDLSGNMSSKQWDEFCNNISKCLSLQKLILTDENNISRDLSDRQWHLFCNALQTCRSLQAINLSGYNFDIRYPSRFKDFCTTLKKCHLLKNLELLLDTDYMNEDQFTLLCQTIKDCTNLESICLWGLNDLFIRDNNKFKEIFLESLTHAQHIIEIRPNNECVTYFEDEIFRDQILKHLNFYYNTKTGTLKKGAHHRPTFINNVQCFTTQISKLSELQQYKNVNFFGQAAFYKNLAPYLTVADSENLRLASYSKQSRQRIYNTL